MKILDPLDRIKEGSRIVYNDGRPGHSAARATVVEMKSQGMTVQFEDRADTTYIAFADCQWMDFIDFAE